jgi:Pyridine nucleotide-disulphide oxidoreductase, dimerisation domain
VFTHPEVAAVGVSQTAIDDGSIQARIIMLPLKTKARAKMSGLRHGFVRLFTAGQWRGNRWRGGRADAFGIDAADRDGCSTPDHR